MPGHHDGAPYINGAFTNWQPVRMKQVIPFCIDNDPLKPDFVQECINEGLISPYVKDKENGQAMTDEESETVMKKQDEYYAEHWHRALLALLRYSNPQVANSELYSVMTLN